MGMQGGSLVVACGWHKQADPVHATLAVDETLLDLLQIDANCELSVSIPHLSTRLNSAF